MRFLIYMWLVVFSIGIMASPNTDKYAPKTESQRREAKIGEGIFGGALYDSDRDGKKQNCIGVNVYLWRSALHSIHFMSKDKLDPFAGVITTHWTVLPETPTERYKVEIHILSQQLVSDGVKVTIFKERKNETGQWTTVHVNPKTAESFENSILTTARAMRVAEERS